jgi:hypothetical protein
MQLDDIIIFLIIAGSIVTSIVRSLSEQNKKKPPAKGQPPIPGQPVQPAQAGQPNQAGQPRQSVQGDLQKRLEEARRRVQQAMENQQGSKGAGEPGTRGVSPTTPPPFISGGLEGTTLEGGSLETSRGLLQDEDYTLKPLVLERERLEGQALKPEEMKRTRLERTFSEGERNVFRPIEASNRNPDEFQQQMKTTQPFISEVAHRGRRQIAAAPPLERKRQRTPTNAAKHAKISGSELLSPEMLTEKELLRGFLWQQILSEPRSKVKLRTYRMSPRKRDG